MIYFWNTLHELRMALPFVVGFYASTVLCTGVLWNAGSKLKYSILYWINMNKHMLENFICWKNSRAVNSSRQYATKQTLTMNVFQHNFRIPPVYWQESLSFITFFLSVPIMRDKSFKLQKTGFWHFPSMPLHLLVLLSTATLNHQSDLGLLTSLMVSCR